MINYLINSSSIARRALKKQPKRVKYRNNFRQLLKH